MITGLGEHDSPLSQPLSPCFYLDCLDDFLNQRKFPESNQVLSVTSTRKQGSGEAQWPTPIVKSSQPPVFFSSCLYLLYSRIFLTPPPQPQEAHLGLWEWRGHGINGAALYQKTQVQQLHLRPLTSRGFQSFIYERELRSLDPRFSVSTRTEQSHHDQDPFKTTKKHETEDVIVWPKPALRRWWTRWVKGWIKTSQDTSYKQLTVGMLALPTHTWNQRKVRRLETCADVWRADVQMCRCVAAVGSLAFGTSNT